MRPLGRIAAAPLGGFFLLALAGPLAAQTATPTLEGARSLVLVRGDRPAEVDDPVDVAIQPDGGLVLVDKGKDDALVFDRNLVWQGNVRSWLADGRLDNPTRAAVDSRGAIWIVEEGARALRLVRDGRDGGRIGGRGDGPGQFGRIDDLDVDLDDHVYVADSDRDRIQVFTPEGILERIVTGFGGLSFDDPVLVGVDPGRRIVVFDRGLEALIAGDPDGSLAWRVSTAERVDRGDVADLAVDDRGTVHLLDRDRRRALAISRSGAVLGETLRSGVPVTFDEPIALDTGPDGTLFVLDRGDRRAQEVRLTYRSAPPVPSRSRTHRVVTGVSTVWQPVAVSPGDGPGEARWLAVSGSGFDIRSPDDRSLATPQGLTRVPDRIVAAGTRDGFVVVDDDDRILRLDRDGRRLGEIERRTAGGELERPRAIAWRPDDGALAVYDEDGDDLLVLHADGRFLRRIGRRGSGPGEVDDVRALAFDADGRLWVVDQRGSRIQVFDRFGVLSGRAPRISGIGTLADLGVDGWGEVYLLGRDSGIVTVLDREDEIVCSGGDPERIDEPERLTVSGAAAWIRRAGGRGEAIPISCTGPPPPPAGVRVVFDDGGDGARIVWSGGHPRASGYRVFRRRGDTWERTGETPTPPFPIPPAAWASAPVEIAVAGLDRDGREGPRSDPVLDRLTPALRALRDRTDEQRAEAWLVEALDELPEGDPAAATIEAHLLRVRARLAAGRGEYDRAIELLESGLERLGEEASRTARAEVYREALAQAVNAGQGELALQWLERIDAAGSVEPTPLEARALELDREGEREVAIALLESYGHHRAEIDGVELARAVAQVRLELGRPVEAIEGLALAGRELGFGVRGELDRYLFNLAETATDRLVRDGDVASVPTTVDSDGEGPASTGLPRVDAVLAALRAYADALGELDREAWEMRIEALSWKPAIQRARELEGASEFGTARELYESILAEKRSLLVSDEIRIRSHLAVIALAQGDEDRAREQLAAALEADPDWRPDEQEFGPSFRDLVERIRLGGGR